MQIRTATTDDQPAWDAYVQGHPEGLAYQLFAWLQAVQRAYGFAQRSVLAEENGAICGLLPLVDFKRPLRGSNLISLPYCDAGGVLADSPAVAEQLLQFASAAAALAGRGLEIRSTRALPVPTANQTDKVRLLLQLPGSAADLQTGLKAKLRSQVHKPQRDGLTAKLGGVELVAQFYPIFARNMRDLGSPVHSRHWIEAVVASYADNCRVGVVFTPEGVPAAAGIILLQRHTVSIPWASAVREYNRLNPNMLLYWTFLAFAADNGYRYFDFGRSTPEEGTYKFKQQWGAQPQPLYWYRLPDVSAPAPGAVDAGRKSFNKRQLAIRLWQKMPLTVANVAGPLVRRCISL